MYASYGEALRERRYGVPHLCAQAARGMRGSAANRRVSSASNERGQRTTKEGATDEVPHCLPCVGAAVRPASGHEMHCYTQPTAAASEDNPHRYMRSTYKAAKRGLHA